MKCFLTPVGGTRQPVPLVADPTWTRHLQGGFGDASVPCRIPPSLARQCRDALLELEADGTVYVGYVNTRTRTDVLECRGYQDRLSWTRRGVWYAAAGNRLFDALEGDCEILTLPSWPEVWQISHSDTNPQGAIVCDFPEPLKSAALISLDNVSQFEWDYSRLAVYYQTGYSRAAGTKIAEFGPEQTSGSFTIPAGATSVQIRAYTVSALPAMAWVRVVLIQGSAVRTTTLKNVFTDIMTDAGITSHECTVDATVEELRFPANSSPLDKITELVRWGDWRAYFTTRPGSSTPVFVFEPMPTVPDYTLTENGNTVTADIAIESRSVASVVRAHFTDEYGRARFAEYADPDTSHFLVNAGRQVYHDIDVETQSYATALSAATALAGKLGADRASGTITLKGAPGGIPASSYVPGLFQLATGSAGNITSRATSITYTGRHKAVVTLDDTVTAEALLTRLASLGSGGNRIR